ncbi:MAG: murein biosynthesis integral membrane protein MurJ, partial [Anaerolineales bacterium]|nr:murein biosynthesis integral membrane protein MurJ [Anaerolineales bacterium]
RVPDFLFHVIAGGALGSAFIPTFTGMLAKDDQPGAWRMASAVVNWVLLASSVLAALAAWLAPWLIQRFMAPGFAPHQIALTATLMRIMLVSTVVFGVSGLLMGVHHSQQHFLSPALAPVLYNAGIIAGAMALAPRWGVRGLAFGVLLGAGLHLGVQLPLLRGYHGQYRLTLGLHNSAVHAVGRLMFPRALGMAVWQVNFWVNTVIASGLPAGSLSALMIAFQIFTFPQAVIAQAIATAMFPTFSAQAARGEIGAMRTSLAASLRSAVYLAIPASVGLWLLGRPLVAMLFQNRTFSAQSTEMVAWALSWYALGLVSHSVVEIVTRAFYALKDTRTPVTIGILAMLINVILSLLLTAVFRAYGLLSHGGLALANTIATTLEMIALLWLLRPRLGGLAAISILKSVARTTAGAAAMTLLLRGWIALAPASGVTLSLVGVTLGGATFWGMTALLGSEEAFRLPALIRQQLRR